MIVQLLQGNCPEMLQHEGHFIVNIAGFVLYGQFYGMDRLGFCNVIF